MIQKTCGFSPDGGFYLKVMHTHRSQARVHHSQLTTATDGETAGSVDKIHTVAHTHIDKKHTQGYTQALALDTVQRLRCEV